MGQDARSVADSAGQVLGTTGLHVADASIMPALIAGNTNPPTMMVAENITRMMPAGDRQKRCRTTSLSSSFYKSEI